MELPALNTGVDVSNTIAKIAQLKAMDTENALRQKEFGLKERDLQLKEGEAESLNAFHVVSANHQKELEKEAAVKAKDALIASYHRDLNLVNPEQIDGFNKHYIEQGVPAELMWQPVRKVGENGVEVTDKDALSEYKKLFNANMNNYKEKGKAELKTFYNMEGEAKTIPIPKDLENDFDINKVLGSKGWSSEKPSNEKLDEYTDWMKVATAPTSQGGRGFTKPKAQDEWYRQQSERKIKEARGGQKVGIKEILMGNNKELIYVFDDGRTVIPSDKGGFTTATKEQTKGATSVSKEGDMFTKVLGLQFLENFKKNNPEAYNKEFGGGESPEVNTPSGTGKSRFTKIEVVKP